MEKTLPTKESVTSWLLGEDQPAVRYHALLDLQGRADVDPEVRRAYAAIPKRGWAHEILRKQKSQGHWESPGDLYRPKYTATNWMALVLSDLGLTKANPRVRKAADLLLNTWMKEDGENIFHDEVCIVGNTARMLTRFGYGDDPRVVKLFDRLLEDQRENGGWHCRETGNGVLDGWEALAAFAVLPKSKRTRRIKRSIERGAEFYLARRLLESGEKYAPWFRLHYPIHYYYDVLVGLDVITKLGYGDDKRLGKALGVLKAKRLSDGRWPLERIHPDPPNYAWGPGNLRHTIRPLALEMKGKPSKWITLTALRVLRRVEDAS